MLIDKYRPKTQDEWIGSKDVLLKITKGINDVLEGTAKHRVILIYGPRGVGKNVSVEIIASHYNLNIIEFNASDERKSDDMMRICRISTTQNLFNDKNIILIDDADGLTKTMQKKLIPILTKTNTPIVICVNDHSKICREIKSKSLKVELKLPTIVARTKLVEDVAAMEGVDLNDDVIKGLANMSTDFRNVLNLLELVLLSNDLEGLEIDNLDKKFEEQIGDVFDDNPPDRFSTDPTTLLHYMSENAMESSMIADADLMLRYQKDADDYRFWRYSFGILSQCRMKRHHKITFPFRTFRRY